MFKSTLDHQAIPFDKLNERDFPHALFEGLRLAQARVDAIRKDSRPPTFANTIEALEAVSEPVDQASTLFHLYRAVCISPRMEKYGDRIDPIFTRFGKAIYTDPLIFERVERLYDSRHDLGLTTEQIVLLEKTYRAFVHSGAKLGTAEKARTLEIDTRLGTLNSKFKRNVNDSTNAYTLVIEDAAELKGLPESAIAAAKQEAETRKVKGWVFTLHAPSVIPFLTYAESRARREELWRAYQARAYSGATDNKPLLMEISRLKAEKAKLLGFASYGHYRLEDRMAKSPETVQTFLKDLADGYRPFAQRDIAELKALAGFDLQSWDVAFYSEKLKQQKYSFESETLRPYFRLDRVVQGAFYAASRLYGIKFIPKPNLPAWDPNVETFEVRDKDDQFLALFYMDPFPRPSKRQGAWMNDIRAGGMIGGALQRPHVLNAGNFTPPLAGEAAQLSWDEVRTVFHEMGHGLHSMLSRVKTASLYGTNVTWDFVELPSQFFENWALEPEVLDVYAIHQETGERIPPALIDKVRRAERFQAGYSGLRQVMLAQLDMAWHSLDAETATLETVEAWESRITEPYRVLPRVSGALISTTFTHIFAGGYAAGYYSYKWAEVLAADAFELFKKNGVFDPTTAKRFLTEVLEKGATEEADVLYRRFRGQPPDPKALPRSEGLSP